MWDVGCAGWAALLGWAGDAGKDELGRLGWPGLAGSACLYIFSFFFGCCSVGFVNLFMLFLTLCSSFGSLCGHFRNLLAPLGDHLEYQGLPWAALCTPFGLL